MPLPPGMPLAGEVLYLLPALVFHRGDYFTIKIFLYENRVLQKNDTGNFFTLVTIRYDDCRRSRRDTPAAE